MDPPVQAARGEWSVPAEAARWLDRLQLGEVEVADRLECFRERTVSQVIRQALEPGGIFDLGFHETLVKQYTTRGES